MLNSFNFIPNNGVNCFVVIFRGRSGSTFLTSKLGSHRQILCHSELFHQNSIGFSPCFEDKEKFKQLRSVQQRDMAPWKFLSEIYSHHKNAKAVGFKIGFNQNYRVLLSTLLHKRVKKIVLQRENSLDSYTSLLIARHSGIWAIPSKNDTDPQSKSANIQPRRVKVESGAFKRYAMSTQLFFGTVRLILRLSQQEWIDIEYNEINDPLKMNSILEFLGVEPSEELQSDIRKQNPMRQEQRIENYEKLKLELKNSKYARYLTSS